MTYIINPLWFYFMDIAEEANVISAIAVCAFAATIVICVIFMAIQIDCGEEITGLKKIVKIFIICLIVSVVVSILIPSKETIVTMMVAKFATYENAAWTLDTVKAAVDYIVNAIANIG